ncbi:MAG: glycosyltransferase, partial [Planctomycetaceae bacterium]|nr:glycosyltransferase [Planctomycetaceae bacterium]
MFPSRSYQRWVERNSSTAEELIQQRAWADFNSDKLLISIVCPLYKTPVEILKETIQSVSKQSYPFWELCLTLSDDESSELRELVLQFASEDQRIRVISIEENRGISESTNAALAEVQGTWVGFLDHDDLLTPDALYAVAKQISDDPECDLVYSDEDLISSNSRFRRSPMLKPSWSPEMIVHFNYICHFVVVRRQLLKKIGGLRSEVDGAQDWDLLLRISEQTQRIRHIPKILYHWRELSTSTAAQLNAKPYVVEAQKRVLQDHFLRRGLTVDVGILRNGHCHPHWTIVDKPLVSVIIPNRDQPKLIQQVVKGIFESTDYRNVEILIVDNQSTHPDVLAYYATIQQDYRVKVLDYSKPFNYSAACNLGAKSA